MEKTYFIAFEGLDGCGKDTQLHKLVEKLKEDNSFPLGTKYSTVWLTREPTKITKPGKKIAELLKGKAISGEEATKYFVEDRKEHSKIIKEVLIYSHVFTSRYDLSTLSYQMTQGMDFDYLYSIHNYGNEGGALIPDITIVFDLPVEVALERSQKRGGTKEFFEVEEFQTKLSKNLKFCIEQVTKKDGRTIIVVNANQSIEAVTKEMCDKISKVIK